MNIKSTSGPRPTHTQTGATQVKSSLQAKPESSPNDTVSFSSNGTKVEVINLRKNQGNMFTHHAAKVAAGAGEGLLIGLLSNGMGPIGASATHGAINGIAEGVSGYQFGKRVGQEIDSPEVASKLSRTFATEGAIRGTTDGLMKGTIVSALTAVTGGNLAVGMAAGVAMNYLL